MVQRLDLLVKVTVVGSIPVTRNESLLFVRSDSKTVNVQYIKNWAVHAEQSVINTRFQYPALCLLILLFEVNKEH